jgi:hypothetical protein
MIKGLSDARRMPRLGKIHLGVKKDKKKDGTPCAPYPTEVDYFVCPPEVQTVAGNKPTALRIMIPVEETERFFPQFYKRYTTSLLICKGDGEIAHCWAEEGGLKEIPCPCDYLTSGECKRVAIFCFLMPDVQGFGIYQITTSSKNSIIDLNSGLDMIRQIAGRVRMIPLVLKREKMEMQRIEDGKPKKSTHYTMKIDLDEKMTLRQLQQSGQIKPEVVLLPPPDESKDDLLYPANGFKPEGEVIDAEPEEDGDGVSEETKRIAELKDELVGIIAQCEEAGLKMTKQAWDQVKALKEEAEYKRAIETFRGRLGHKTQKKTTGDGLPF